MDVNADADMISTARKPVENSQRERRAECLILQARLLYLVKCTANKRTVDSKHTLPWLPSHPVSMASPDPLSCE